MGGAAPCVSGFGLGIGLSLWGGVTLSFCWAGAPWTVGGAALRVSGSGPTLPLVPAVPTLLWDSVPAISVPTPFLVPAVSNLLWDLALSISGSDGSDLVVIPGSDSGVGPGSDSAVGSVGSDSVMGPDSVSIFGSGGFDFVIGLGSDCIFGFGGPDSAIGPGSDCVSRWTCPGLYIRVAGFMLTLSEQVAC